MEYSPFVELTREEAVTLVQIANGGDADAEDISDSNVTRLQSRGLVEQRGLSLGLTAMGIHTVARLRRGY